MFIGPGPGMLQKFITGKVRFLDTLFGKALDDLGLGGNTGMVGARYPTGVLTLHTRTAYEDILYCFIQYMAHVKDARHIRGWNNHRVSLTAIGFTAERLVVQPILIPFVLNF